MKCPKCQSENRDNAKFCDECGQRLDRAVEISTFGGERKHVTVLFSDLSGYTAMSEKLDPEDVKNVMAEIFGEIAKIVTKYEGVIDKFIGDAVMAIFGVPKAHEDDPVRAIRAAMEIHDLVADISTRFEKTIEQPLSMHTGVNTGLVVTGEVDIGKGTQGFVGNAINLASRLEGVAKAGEIVVGSDTYRQAQNHFDFEALEPTIVKGKAKAVKVYKVLAIKDAPDRFHRFQGLKAGLTGRNKEMSVLLEAVERLREGCGSVVAICGEAGTGKSRLVEELKSTVNPGAIQWREGHAYAYSQNIPYFPVRNLLSRAWLINEGDSTEQIREKVEAGATLSLRDRKDLIPFVGSLYSLHYPQIEQVSPDNWKARLQEAIWLILSDFCESNPTIICIEDLHWSDSSSTELLRFVLKDFQVPALFICSYRPPFSLFTKHELSGLGKGYVDIKLQDLSTSEAEKMVESLLNTEVIPAHLRRFIQTRVEGNPLYLEEAINSLIDSETLIRENGTWKLTKEIGETVIPSTIQGIITARLDRLDFDDKRVLQEASVIGRAFLYDILKRISDLKEFLDRSLKNLERLDFIRARTLQPDLEYVFKHALTQEVVYNGLLKKERQVLHERIGLVIEQLFYDRLPEFYETLSFHYTQGQSNLKGVHYLTKAGEKSFKQYALDESHACFKEAFGLLSDKSERTQEDEKLLIELIIKWGYTLHLTADFVALSNLFKAHEALVESHASKEHLEMFYGWLGFALGRRERLREGYQYLLRALQIAEEIGDVKAIGYNCAWLAHTCADMDLLEEAIIFGERAREIANRFESDQYLFGIAFMFSAYAYFFRGDVKKTADFGQTLLEYGRKFSDLRSIAFHYFVMGLSRSSAGDFPLAIDFFRKAIEASPDPMTSNVTKTLLGRCYLVTGQLKEAQHILEEVIEHSEQFGYEMAGTTSQAFKGMVLIAQGNLKQGIGLYENAMRVCLERKSLVRYAGGNYLMGTVYSKIAEGKGGKRDFSFLIKNIGFLIKTLPLAHRKAEEHFDIAIKTAKEIGAKGILGQAYLGLSLLHRAKNRTGQAIECVSEAIQLFEQCEAEVYLEQARDVLASLG